MKRMISVVLVLTMIFGMVPVMTIPANAFNIDKLTGSNYFNYLAANQARLLENTNIFAAQYYGQGTSEKTAADNRLRERASSMLYQHFAEIEAANTKKAVFSEVWAVVSVDTEKFSGLKETDLYAGVLWAMMTGNYNASSIEIEPKMEDFNGVANDMVMEFVEWYTVEVVKSETTEMATEILKKWEMDGIADPETVVLWYGDHFTSISEEIESEERFFKDVGDVFEIADIVIKASDSIVEFITKMSQIQTLYSMAHLGYLDFLNELLNGDLDPQLKTAAKQLLELMNSASYEEALEEYIIDLVCQDGVEIALDKLSDVLSDVAEKVLSKAVSSSILLGVKLGMEAANLLLGVEDQLATRYNIMLLDSMTNAIFDTSQRLRMQFYATLAGYDSTIADVDALNKALPGDANAYVTSIEMCYRFLLQTDVYVEQYMDARFKNFWSDLWNLDDEAYKTYTNVLTGEIASLRRSFDNLIEDSNHLYEEIYPHLVNQIYYEADGWENVPETQTKEFRVDVRIPYTKPTKEGFLFAGWYDSKNGERYEAGQVISANYSEDIILSPTWTYDNREKISYNANGGTGAPAAHENTKGSTSLSGIWPQRTGYVFLGWAEDPNETENLYAPGAAFPKDGNVTLYAIWKPGTFDIIFHANGGVYADGSDSVTLKKTYLQSFIVNPEIPTRERYVFSGWWSLKPDGTNDYEQGRTYNDIGSAGLEAKHLYAKWEMVEAAFVYDYSNCTAAEPILIPMQNGSGSYTLVDPPLEKQEEIGKEFVQWKYYYPDGTYEYYQSGDTITITGDMTVYAEWKNPNIGTILSVLTDQTSYVPGDIVELNITAEHSGYFRVDASNHNGFTMKCADGTKAAKGVFVENASASSAENLKCYDNGSTYTVFLSIPKNCSDGSYSVKIIASNGTYDPDIGNSVTGTETSVITETITIKVDTTPEEKETFILSYDLNGGYGAVPASVSFEAYQYVALADDNRFSRDGYTFAGWSKESDGGGKKYKADKEYQFTESLVLYAIWEPIDGYGKLELDLMVERYSKVYKPGETAHVFVYPDYSNHFFFDVGGCRGFTLKNAGGIKTTSGTWFAKTSPNYDSAKEGYNDGEMIPIYIYIPANCSDGQYTFFVTAANGVLGSDDTSSGDKLKKSVTIIVRKSDKADAVHLNKAQMEIHVGDEKRLKATIEPTFFEDKEVSWKTSNNSVVSIDDKGNRADITGLKSGVATITATVDGVSASCQVTVVNCDYAQKIVEAEYLASPASCINQATYYYVCECGDKGRATYKIGELAEHTYSDWTTIKAATETAVGIEQRTCSGCKHTEERQIPALPHTHEYGEVVFAWAKDYSSVIASVTCDKCPDGNSEKTLSTNCEVFFDDSLDNRLIVSADGMLNGEYVTDALVIRVLNGTLMMPMKPAEKMMILIAGYDAQGRMVDFQIETEPDKNVTITSTGSFVKVFFLNEETYEPLLPTLPVK